jgi:excisionase family DNA binding protein
MSQNSKNLLNVREVAELFGVNVSTVWRWVQAGHFPTPVRICGTTRFRATEVYQIIEQGAA